jgi:hypothetical protein
MDDMETMRDFAWVQSQVAALTPDDFSFGLIPLLLPTLRKLEVSQSGMRDIAISSALINQVSYK